jgi:hypothetical protein
MNIINTDYLPDMISYMIGIKWSHVDHFFIKELEFIVGELR